MKSVFVDVAVHKSVFRVSTKLFTILSKNQNKNWKSEDNLNLVFNDPVLKIVEKPRGQEVLNCV